MTGGVSEVFGYDLDGDAVGDEQRGVGVAQVVKSGSRRAAAPGIGSAMTDGMPAPSLLASEWIEAVAGDDVEAVLALHDVAHLDSVDDFDTNPKRPPATGAHRSSQAPEANRVTGSDCVTLLESWLPAGRRDSNTSAGLPRRASVLVCDHEWVPCARSPIGCEDKWVILAAWRSNVVAPFPAPEAERRSDSARDQPLSA